MAGRRAHRTALNPTHIAPPHPEGFPCPATKPQPDSPLNTAAPPYLPLPQPTRDLPVICRASMCHWTCPPDRHRPSATPQRQPTCKADVSHPQLSTDSLSASSGSPGPTSQHQSSAQRPPRKRAPAAPCSAMPLPLRRAWTAIDPPDAAVTCKQQVDPAKADALEEKV